MFLSMDAGKAAENGKIHFVRFFAGPALTKLTGWGRKFIDIPGECARIKLV